MTTFERHVPPQSHPDCVHQQLLPVPLAVSYTPVHPLVLLFSANPTGSDSQDADNASSLSSLFSISRRLNVFYIFLALLRDAPEMQSRKHTAMHTRTYSHFCSTPTGTSTTTDREIRFSPSARASKRRYDGDDACAPPPIHPFPPGHFRGAFEAATLLSQCPARTPCRHSESTRTLVAARALRFRGCLTWAERVDDYWIDIFWTVLDQISRNAFLSILPWCFRSAAFWRFLKFIRFLEYLNYNTEYLRLTSTFFINKFLALKILQSKVIVSNWKSVWI